MYGLVQRPNGRFISRSGRLDHTIRPEGWLEELWNTGKRPFLEKTMAKYQDSWIRWHHRFLSSISGQATSLFHFSFSRRHRSRNNRLALCSAAQQCSLANSGWLSLRSIVQLSAAQCIRLTIVAFQNYCLNMATVLRKGKAKRTMCKAYCLCLAWF